MTASSSSSHVLIVGSMAFDDLHLPTGSFPSEVGGSATFAALSASLFAPARLVAVVGEDFPEATLALLRERGSDVQGVERAAGKTFRWAGRYADDLASRTTLDTQLNVFAEFQPRLPEAYRDGGVVLLGNIHPRLQLEVLSQVKAPLLVAADTMNFWIEGEREALLEVLARVDLLVINDEELRLLARERNLVRAAGLVRQLGPRSLVVKRGEHGALLFDDDGAFYAPAWPLEAEVDPTGAGDTFAGALLGWVARSGSVDARSLRQGLHVAATVASFCVEDVGTRRLSTLTRGHVTSRLEALARLVRVD
ncbi:MAG: sugar kinase [Polyangiaceae bacterium]|nr:sugar kinase [Polyangiaceae bacterium]